MKTAISLGVRIYGLGAVATGLVGLAWGDFALQWQPVAATFPGRAMLAYLFAALLLLGGLAVNWSKSAALGAALISGLYVVVVVIMHGVDVIQHPGTFGTYGGVAEQLALLAGGVAAYACLTSGPRSDRLLRTAFIAMGICLVIFGAIHFVYLKFTADFVPAWIPGGQTFWAILTGVAHIAAGVALLTGIQARLALVLATIMFASFSVLIHIPHLMVDSNHLNWVMNAVNLSLTGAAWVIADGLARLSIDRVRLGEPARWPPTSAERSGVGNERPV